MPNLDTIKKITYCVCVERGVKNTFHTSLYSKEDTFPTLFPRNHPFWEDKNETVLKASWSLVHTLNCSIQCDNGYLHNYNHVVSFLHSFYLHSFTVCVHQYWNKFCNTVPVQNTTIFISVYCRGLGVLINIYVILIYAMLSFLGTYLA